ncbi:MAG: YkgJ family cysteine cluster protein [Phycisphaerae bacterium]|nr:YkgJ family cysteine cluster protein [Phycisphaerae bacterium]
MAESLCMKCAGLCCKYLALPIETPENKGDFDDIRWYLAHEGISVFVEKEDWYINVATRCKYLDKNNMCDIYETRPKICRAYKEDNCDFHSGDYGYDLHFTSLEDLDDYIQKEWKKKK